MPQQLSDITQTDTKRHYGAQEAMPLLVIDNQQCYAVISLVGGQILEYKQHDKTPLLWLSPKVVFKTGTAIRGGIPLCAPWFGKHPKTNFPNHGFTRTSLWRHSASELTTQGNISIALELSDGEHSKIYYDNNFTMRLTFELGGNLSMQFSMLNNGDTDLICGWALHSYFNVVHIEQTQVDGLAGYSYVDTLEAGQQRGKTLKGALTFSAEVDNYFINASSEQSIGPQPSIIISGTNCPSTITWNPGQQLAEKMPDIGGDNYQKFVCVERGAIFDDSWHIQGGAQQSATLLFTQ